MSKQSEAKEAQGYSKHSASCGNCANFKSEITRLPAPYDWRNELGIEKNRRCGIGGFAVGRNGHCTLWTRAAQASGEIEGGAT